MDEAHVQHTIRLIQHKGFDMVKVHKALIHQVPQASGTGDDHIRTAPKGVDLSLLVHAAENHRRIDRQSLAVEHEVVIDLLGKLAGRRENQCADGSRLTEPHGIFSKALNHGKRKRGGLAGAGLRAAEHVPAG